MLARHVAGQTAIQQAFVHAQGQIAVAQPGLVGGQQEFVQPATVRAPTAVHYAPALDHVPTLVAEALGTKPVGQAVPPQGVRNGLRPGDCLLRRCAGIPHQDVEAIATQMPGPQLVAVAPHPINLQGGLGGQAAGHPLLVRDKPVGRQHAERLRCAGPLVLEAGIAHGTLVRVEGLRQEVRHLGRGMASPGHRHVQVGTAADRFIGRELRHPEILRQDPNAAADAGQVRGAKGQVGPGQGLDTFLQAPRPDFLAHRIVPGLRSGSHSSPSR